GEFIDRIHAEDRGAAAAALDRAVAVRASYTAEDRIVRPDGSIRWVRGSGRPVYGKEGQISDCARGVVDVTGRPEKAAALRRSEERFAKAFQMSPDCVAISDANGVVEINERYEEITGYPCSTIIGRSMLEQEMSRDRGRVDAALRQLQQRGSVRDF